MYVETGTVDGFSTLQRVVLLKSTVHVGRLTSNNTVVTHFPRNRVFHN